MNATEKLIVTGLFVLMGLCFSIRLPMVFEYQSTPLLFSGILIALILGLSTWLILTLFRQYFLTHKRLIITGLFVVLGFFYGSQFPFALVYGTTQLLVAGLLEALLLGLATWLILTVFKNSDWSDKRLIMTGLFTIVGFCWGSMLPSALTIGSTPVFLGGLFVALVLGLITWFISRMGKRINYRKYGIFCMTLTPFLLFFSSYTLSMFSDCFSVGNVFVMGVECYYRPNPLIDTVLPPDFSEEKFFSIKPGMDRNQVIALLGQPEYPAQNHLSYGHDGGSDWWDFAWIDYYINIDNNDKVIVAERRIAHD
ncbi:MAG: hypothetical protein F6K58_23835 [Symploca sp. SIO2E9]|nr:hypothetical protein [Symploca sp. SIO2E9]